VLDELDIDAFELPYDVEAVPPLEFAHNLVRAGVTISGIYTSSRYALAGRDASEARRVIDICLEISAETGCRSLMVYLGTPPDLRFERAIDHSAAVLSPVVERAAGFGVTVVVENLFDIKADDPLGNGILRTPERLSTLFNRLPAPNFGLNFDPCNFYIAGLGSEEIAAAYRTLRDRINYIHIKDATRTTRTEGRSWPAGRVVHDEVGGDFKFVPVGEGEAGIAAVVEELVRDRFAGFVAVEALCEPMIETYRRSVATVRSYMDNSQGVKPL
jgi:sugar phosphate isomerase/epimerase